MPKVEFLLDTYGFAYREFTVEYNKELKQEPEMPDIPQGFARNLIRCMLKENSNSIHLMTYQDVQIRVLQPEVN